MTSSRLLMDTCVFPALGAGRDPPMSRASVGSDIGLLPLSDMVPPSLLEQRSGGARWPVWIVLPVTELEEQALCLAVAVRKGVDEREQWCEEPLVLVGEPDPSP